MFGEHECPARGSRSRSRTSDDRALSSSCSHSPWCHQLRGSVPPPQRAAAGKRRGSAGAELCCWSSLLAPRVLIPHHCGSWEQVGRAGEFHTELEVPAAAAAAAELLCSNSAAKPVQSELCSGSPPCSSIPCNTSPCLLHVAVMGWGSSMYHPKESRNDSGFFKAVRQHPNRSYTLL